MIPVVLLVIGIAYLGIKTGQASRNHTSVGHIAASPKAMKRRINYIALLQDVAARGGRPSNFLIGEATREAMTKNDWQTVKLISDTFGPPPAPQEHAPQEQATEVVGRKSPMEGVSDEDWVTFAEAMKTKEATFRNDRLLGAWEHNLGRLRQLGIDEPIDEEQQYAAFCKDMQTYAETEAKMLNDYSGEVVGIEGKDHAVTPSGILGLLKSAGSQGAKSWLTNEADRKRFPNTTQSFLRANGAF